MGSNHHYCMPNFPITKSSGTGYYAFYTTLSTFLTNALRKAIPTQRVTLTSFKCFCHGIYSTNFPTRTITPIQYLIFSTLYRLLNRTRLQLKPCSTSSQAESNRPEQHTISNTVPTIHESLNRTRN